MFEYAQRSLPRLPTTMEDLLKQIRHFENDIHKEGNKSFILYLADPVNYWEVYGRLVMYAIHHFRREFLFPGMSNVKELKS